MSESPLSESTCPAMHAPRPACPSPDASAPAPCPRRYTLGRRQAARDETRRRIIEASVSLLMEQGGVAFTIDRVARAAGVTRQTVHNQFGTRAQLLEAVSERAIDSEAFGAMPRVFQQPDPHRALDLMAAIFCRFWTTNRLFLRRMRGLAHTDPELEGVIRPHDERRLMALRGFVQRHGLATGEERERLARRLYAVTGFEFFDSLWGEGATEESVAAELGRVLRLCLQSP